MNNKIVKTRKLNENEVVDANNRSGIISYREIFSKPNEVLQQMKDNWFYNGWRDTDYNALEYIVNFLSISKHKVRDLSGHSLFMCLHLVVNNFNFEMMSSDNEIPTSDENKEPLSNTKENSKHSHKNKPNPLKNLPFVDVFDEHFLNGGKKFKEFFPMVSHHFDNAFLMYEKCRESTYETNGIKIKTILKLIYEIFKKTNNYLIDEIIDRYWRNTIAFESLPALDKKFIVSNYIDMNLLNHKLELFEFRYRLISNFFGSNKKTFADILTFQKKVLSTKIFYVPIIIESYNTSDFYEISGEKFQLFRHDQDSTYIITDNHTKLKSIIEHLKLNSKFSRVNCFDDRRKVLVHLNDNGIILNKINDHKSLTKTVWRHDTDGLYNYQWSGAVENIQKNKDEIFAVLNSTKPEHSELIKFLDRALNSIYTFREDGEDIFIFLNAWFVVESISSNLSSKTYNDKITQTIENILHASDDSVSKFNLKSMVMFRNHLVHGGSSDNSQVGLYNVILNTTISYLVVFFLENIELLDVLTFSELIKFIKYKK